LAQSDGALVDRLVSCPGKERTVVSGRLRVSSTGMNCPVLPSLPPILLSGFLLLIPASPSSVAVASSARMPKRSSRPRDLNQLAKLITDQATGQASPELASREDGKNPAAVALGRLGGLKGGKARAEKLSERKRKEIAKKAAAARWAVRSSTT
jgi:hypothetical protein